MTAVTVATGHGYGPVTMTFENGLTPDGLAQRADSDGEVPVFAYAPNAGDPRDEWNRERLVERLGDGAIEFRVANWATPLQMVAVRADDPAALVIAADSLRELYRTFAGMLDEDEWDALPKCDVCGIPESWEDHDWCGEHGNHVECCDQEHEPYVGDDTLDWQER